MRSPTVHAVIAVKSLDRAKTRLAAALTPSQRARLVLAMLADTVRAAAAAPEIAGVTVVTPDPRVAEHAHALGADVHPEPPGAPADPDALNTALTVAAAELRARHGEIGVLALQADLPALRAGELSAVLAAGCTDTRSLVTDHTGTGTAALFAPARIALRPRFGPGSAQRHIAEGAVAATGDWPGLRLDIDTAADLDTLLTLGAGCDTAALLAELGWKDALRPPVIQVC